MLVKTHYGIHYPANWPELAIHAVHGFGFLLPRGEYTARAFARIIRNTYKFEGRTAEVVIALESM